MVMSPPLRTVRDQDRLWRALKSGTLTAVVTKNAATTNVMVQFTACGQYTVTRS